MTTTRLPDDTTWNTLRNTHALVCTCPHPDVTTITWATRICGRCGQRPVLADLRR